MSYDDHEVDNDWAGDTTEENTPPELFLLRRAAAFQAWYEHMPVRRAQMPRGPDILAYRRFGIGDLVEHERARHAALPLPASRAAAASKRIAPRRSSRTAPCSAKRRSAGSTTASSTPSARWTVLAQQVIVMRNDRDPDPNVFAPSMDKWDGAVAARDRLFTAIEAAKVANVVVLTGDIHQNWAGELKKNFADEKSATLGVEFVATSIASAATASTSTTILRRCCSRTRTLSSSTVSAAMSATS